MHVPDGFLAPQITIPAYAVAAPLWAYSVRRHFGTRAVDSLPIVGSLTAVAFAIQSVMIPVPGGTSTHLVGCALLAMVTSPLVAFVCESLVLAVQATFFGAGGITVLAVNALAIGLLGPLAAAGAYRLLRRVDERLAAFVGAWLAMQVSSGAVVLVLGLQHALSPDHFPMPLAPAALAMLLPSATVAGALEGVYTVFALSLLRKVNLRAAG